MTTLYFILAQTGCSCCREENFLNGPYLDQDKALDAASWMEKGKALASQYAPRGKYTLITAEGEEPLPDGRIICGDRIFDLGNSWGRLSADAIYDLKNPQSLSLN